jgi:hypothetical protein
MMPHASGRDDVFKGERFFSDGVPGDSDETRIPFGNDKQRKIE